MTEIPPVFLLHSNLLPLPYIRSYISPNLYQPPPKLQCLAQHTPLNHPPPSNRSGQGNKVTQALLFRCSSFKAGLLRVTLVPWSTLDAPPLRINPSTLTSAPCIGPQPHAAGWGNCCLGAAEAIASGRIDIATAHCTAKFKVVALIIPLIPDPQTENMCSSRELSSRLTTRAHESCRIWESVREGTEEQGANGREELHFDDR